MKNTLRAAALALCLALALSGCSHQALLHAYEHLIGFAGSLALTHWPALTGERDFGADAYTGRYHADYTGTTTTEYLFGGTGLTRDAGPELELTCTLQADGGKARIFWLSGSGAPQTLLEVSGTYCGTLTLPAGQNYIGVECLHFTGSVDLILR